MHPLGDCSLWTFTRQPEHCPEQDPWYDCIMHAQSCCSNHYDNDMCEQYSVQSSVHNRMGSDMVGSDFCATFAARLPQGPHRCNTGCIQGFSRAIKYYPRSTWGLALHMGIRAPQGLQWVTQGIEEMDQGMREITQGLQGATQGKQEVKQGMTRGHAMQCKGCSGQGPHIVLLEQGDGQVLQDVMLDTCSVLCADPVLGGGPDEALSAVLILHPTCISSQVTVDVTQMHQDITVVALHPICRCACRLQTHDGQLLKPGHPPRCGQF